MYRNNLLSVATLLVGTFGCSIAMAQDIGDAQRGAAVASSQCADCHGVVAGQRSPNAMAPAFDAIAATPGMTEMALLAALLTTHRAMPNVMLEGADRADVIAYIQSLNTQK